MTQENLNVLHYVDKNNQLIYEVQVLSDCVLVRPATPALYKMIERLTMEEFDNRFEEFYGDLAVVKAFAAVGKPAPFTVETRH